MVGGKFQLLTWGDAFYFSVVTFSSLGYGDITPFGIGKLVVSVEVFFGLALTAIFVGKIASERQSALILLQYTSGQQERISGFVADLTKLNEKIDEAILNNDFEALTIYAGEGYAFLSSICSYLIVHANQGDIASFGNTSTLRKLYSSFFKYQRTALNAMHQYGLDDRTTIIFGNTVGKLSGNAKRMSHFHTEDERTIGILKTVMENGRALTRFNEKIKSGKLVIRAETNMTSDLLNAVRIEMKAISPARDNHKLIARKLGISNGLSSKCMKKILEEQA